MEGKSPRDNRATVYNDLVRFETELWNALETRLRSEHYLPLARFEFMRVIARTGGCRVNDIAEELVITIGGASKIVDRIEASGYCIRRANPDDKRSSIIELTPAGTRVLEAATVTFHDELAARIPLPHAELEHLAATLATLRA